MRAIPGLFFLLFCLAGLGCANIVPPSGGDKDTEAPVLVSVMPGDSVLNTRPSRIELRFDEYVTVQDAAGQITISPLLPIPLTASADRKRVILQIPDTLLQDGTTYRVRFGRAIQDLHEGNPFGDFAYTFSTGSYFDSLRLKGRVFSAATGVPDSAATIILHPATVNDTAVLRQKPLYTVRADATGSFTLDGLPANRFRLYALGDANNNLIADAGERIAFLDSLVMPTVAGDSIPMLRTFTEGPDTANAADFFKLRGSSGAQASAPSQKGGLSYTLGIDTTDAAARTADLNAPIRVSFSSAIAALSTDRIFLSYDSAGTTVEAGVAAKLDTATRTTATLAVAWRPDALYTLRMLKGFARDTAGGEAPPSRYRFRTRRDEDYGKLTVRIPGRYYGAGFVLHVVNETDTVHAAPVTDTTVQLSRLRPTTYVIRIIEDANRNGQWDPGNLLARKQPELVVPHNSPIPLKAGWQALVDFAPTGGGADERRERRGQSRP